MLFNRLLTANWSRSEKRRRDEKKHREEWREKREMRVRSSASLVINGKEKHQGSKKGGGGFLRAPLNSNDGRKARRVLKKR